MFRLQSSGSGVGCYVGVWLLPTQLNFRIRGRVGCRIESSGPSRVHYVLLRCMRWPMVCVGFRA